MAVRYLEKFTNVAGTVTYTWGTNGLAISHAQALRTPMAVGIGADFQHDYLGYGVSPKEPAHITASWQIVQSTAALVDTELTTASQKLYLIGKGYLYTLGADGSRYFCEARLASMPAYKRTGGQLTHLDVSCEFIQLSNWRSTAATTGSQAVTHTSEAFTIANGGELPVYDAVFLLTPLSSSGVVGPIMTNSTNGYAWTSTRTLDATTKLLRNDNSRQIIEYSSDTGSTYADDYALVTRGTSQIGLMALAPGNNSITMTRSSGTPNYTFSWSFYAQHAA